MLRFQISPFVLLSGQNELRQTLAPLIRSRGPGLYTFLALSEASLRLYRHRTLQAEFFGSEYFARKAQLRWLPRAGPPRHRARAARAGARRTSIGKISAKCCSFSAVSAPIFCKKIRVLQHFFKIYQIIKLKFLQFDKILQNLRHLHFFC